MQTRILIVTLALSILGGSLITSTAQPTNDLFARRIVLSGTNTLASGSNVGAAKEAGEPNHAHQAGGKSVWWTWTAPADGLVTVSTAGSSFDTLLGIYTGTNVSALSEKAYNDDEASWSGIYSSKTMFCVRAGQSHQIAVDGYGGASGTIQLRVDLAAHPMASDWTLPDVDGQMVCWSNFTGKVVILDFWATWCGPCVAEIPDFISLQNQYGADGLAVVGLSVDADGPQVVKDFIASHGINYTVAMADSAIRQDYGGIASIPTTFIIDRQNEIRQMFVGSRSRSTFENEVLPLLYSNLPVACCRQQSQMVLQWPATAATFRLQAAASLSHPTWSDLPDAPQTSNGMNTVRLPWSPTNRFFRLRLQN